MLEHEYDKFSETYDNNYDTEAYRHEDEELMRIIAKFAIGRTLDIGSGTGLYLDYAKVHRLDYVGIEPSQGMLDKALEKHPDHRFIKGTLEEQNVFELGQFDTVIALYGVASYLRPDRYSLVTDLTKRGGTYFLMAYKDGYFPAFYTDEMKEAVKANADHERLGQLKGARQFEFTNYLITTNAVVDLGEAA